MFEELPSTGTFVIPPVSSGNVKALSSIGYELEHAFADIIDNSIDAKASRVEITFFRDDEKLHAVMIADDGRGMNEEAVKTAMQFYGTIDHQETDLGTFGAGLKTASLSQCRSLTVISLQAGRFAACRWTAELIDRGWECEQINSQAAAKLFPTGFSDGTGETLKSGTVIVWDRLQRLGVSQLDLNEFLDEHISTLRTKLGLLFHRFLEKKSLRIVLRAYNVADRLGIPTEVAPLNPFRYTKSGSPHYPKHFITQLDDTVELDLVAHIWPPNSIAPEFRLSRGRPTAWQGFYFYRNDRLIQTGGWNDFVKDATDPELSLARVSIDLPPAGGPKTNIQKSAVQLNAALAHSFRRAKCGSLTLTDYLEAARGVYRNARKRHKANLHLPLVPGEGISVELRHTARAIITRKNTSREIAFEWVSMKRKQVFELDIEEDRIFLNRTYRRRILGTAAATITDAPVIKILLFLLLKNIFDRERLSSKRKQWLAECNALLYEVIKRL